LKLILNYKQFIFVKGSLEKCNEKAAQLELNNELNAKDLVTDVESPKKKETSMLPYLVLFFNNTNYFKYLKRKTIQ
jgi:hypothetical protein